MRTLCLLALFMLIVGARGGAEEATSSQPTLRIMQDMMTSAADSLFALVPPSPGLTVQTMLLPPTTYWYLEQPTLDALRRRNLVPSQSPEADYVAEFGVTRSGVLYGNLRRTWFLGSQIVDRSVQLTVWTKLVERKTGTVIAAQESQRSFTDTVNVADVETLETPGIPATRGALPSPGLFSSIVEPVVLVGSIAVAIVLLFSVRS